MTWKRSWLITIAGAGALAVAAASVAAATLPAGSTVPKAGTAYAHLPAVNHPQDARPATQVPDTQGPDGFGLVLSSLGQRQYAYKMALRKAIAHELAAAHTAHETHLRQLAAQQAATQQATAQPTATQRATAQPVATQQAAAPSEPSGSPRQIAEAMLSQFGWSSSQFSCLDPLWAQESGWSVTAQNPGSGAYGIPQALPGSKMASAGPDWQTDAATQVRWGLQYIQATYGSPCAAWSHEQADGWY